MGSKKRKFADDGWAVWIDGDDRSKIYLNDWINPKGKSYIDVSVRVYGAKETKNVNFFIPFGVEKNEICDLSDMLADGSALRALFNTNGKVIAEKIYERHRILTDILLSLGVSPEVASDDACKIEHHISDESFNALKNKFYK